MSKRSGTEKAGRGTEKRRVAGLQALHAPVAPGKAVQRDLAAQARPVAAKKSAPGGAAKARRRDGGISEKVSPPKARNGDMSKTDSKAAAAAATAPGKRLRARKVEAETRRQAILDAALS